MVLTKLYVGAPLTVTWQLVDGGYHREGVVEISVCGEYVLLVDETGGRLLIRESPVVFDWTEPKREQPNRRKPIADREPEW